MRRSRVLGPLLGISLAIGLADPSHARPDMTLWVVQSPGELVAFDLTDFSRVGGVRIPVVAFDDPSILSVNGRGQILVPVDGGRLWLWDGFRARVVDADSSLTGSRRHLAPGTRASREWFLGGDDRSVYLLESAPPRTGRSADDSVRTRVRIERLDLGLRPKEVVLDRTCGPCAESMRLVAARMSCPDAELWASGGVVRDWFVLTTWEQDAPAEHRRSRLVALPPATATTSLFRRQGAEWSGSRLPPTDTRLDFRDKGAVWVGTTRDDGCCGWENGSSDRTLCGSVDTTVVLVDEWERFRNQGHDVSFFTAAARIAPISDRVAYTIHATTSAGATIRPSADATPDTSALASIRRSLAELPLVEVVEWRPRFERLLHVAHAELVGWASDSEVVLVQDGTVVVIDVRSGRRRQSGIPVRSVADARVVWR